MKKKTLFISCFASFILTFMYISFFYQGVVHADFKGESKILSNDQKVVNQEKKLKEVERFEEIDSKANVYGTINNNSKKIIKNKKSKSMVKAATANGLQWEIVDGVLTVSGTGEIKDATNTKELEQTAPWYSENSKIKKVVINSGITKIGSGAFFNCTNLTEIELPSTLTTIGEFAFQKTALRTFNIPSSLTSIAYSAFYNVPLEEFTGGSTNFQVKDGVLYTDNFKTLFKYPTDKPDATFEIPNGVTKLGYESFFLTTKLKSVTIPDSVVSAEAFVFCRSSIEKVKFGNGLKCTSLQMFAASNNLKEIDWGTGIEAIFNQTFMECRGLTNVTLPSNIKLVGAGAFNGCTELKSFTSNSLSIVAFQMFYNCYNLTTVNLNEGITTVARSAFYGCYKLKDITLPKSVTFAHSLAFLKTTKVACKNKNLSKYGENGCRYLNQVKVKGARKYNTAFEVLKMVNSERKKQGLSALKMDSGLLETAMTRAAENSVLFSHTRPDGSICFDLDNKMIAENVAFGQRTAKEVMKAWMNSPGHRANILSKNATTIGIGCFYHNGVFYWSQNFGNGNNKSDCSKPKDKNKTQKLYLATEKFTEAITTTDVVYSTGKEYTYNYTMKLDKTLINKKKSTNASISLANAGYPYVKAVIDNSSFKWSSGHKKTATVNSNGKITGKSDGVATITAKLKHSKFSKKITVGKKVNKPGKIKLSSVKSNKENKITVKWKKDNSIAGYQICYSTDKNFEKNATKTVTISNNKTTSKDIKKLTKGKKYYVQIRAYRNEKVDGKNQKLTGNWSGSKKVTI